MNFRKRFMLHFSNHSMFKANLLMATIFMLINFFTGNLLFLVSLGIIGKIVVSLFYVLSNAVWTQIFLSLIYSLLKNDERVIYFKGDGDNEQK